MRQSIKKEIFGYIGNHIIVEYTVYNGSGMSFSAINYGGALTSIMAPDRDGNLENVILRFDNLRDYERPTNPFMGSIIGRYSNRISNAHFILEGNQFLLSENITGATLHGGAIGFDKVIWDITPLPDNLGIMLRYTSQDGDQGFPGTLSCTIEYQLLEDNSLMINYHARTDKPTPVSLTSHPYFNLSGKKADTILDHFLTIAATKYIEANKNLLPTGNISEVGNSSMNFITPKKISRDFNLLDNGYDFSWVILNTSLRSNYMNFAAELYDNLSGRCLIVYTSQPAIHFYSGNFLDGTFSSDNGARVIGKHAGLCLETQSFPDSPNHPSFPSCILYPESTYQHSTIFQFITK